MRADIDCRAQDQSHLCAYTVSVTGSYRQEIKASSLYGYLLATVKDARSVAGSYTGHLANNDMLASARSTGAQIRVLPSAR